MPEKDPSNWEYLIIGVASLLTAFSGFIVWHYQNLITRFQKVEANYIRRSELDRLIDKNTLEHKEIANSLGSGLSDTKRMIVELYKDMLKEKRRNGDSNKQTEEDL